MFVIWKQLFNDNKKDRIIVNIREFNKIIKFDVYLLSFQSNIIIIIIETLYIFIINDNNYFYKFYIRYKD